jgi:hypothetical protein
MAPLCKQVTLKPSVGFTSLILLVPDVTWAKMVLFPALSSPSTRIRLSGLSSNYDRKQIQALVTNITNYFGVNTIFARNAYKNNCDVYLLIPMPSIP